MEIINILLNIIENPFLEKNYIELKKYYEQNNMINEAKAIDTLINEKFNNNNLSN